MIGDDPEIWTTSAWSGFNNVLLEEGSFPSSNGLVFFYFQNKLGVNARLYVGALGSSSATTFSYAVGRRVVGSGADFAVAGATAEEKFLQPFVSGKGYAAASAPASPATPRPLFSPIAMSNGQLATGEISIANASGPTTFYIYADDCSPTPCPGILNVAPDDGNQRGGDFADAHFSVVHNWTVSISNSSGGIAYMDVGRTPNDSCLPAIPGNDPLRNPGMRMLLGDYGVPIQISGTPLGPFEQFWYLNPRGNVPYASASWVANMTDPANDHNVAIKAYYLPTTAPSAAPQPTVVPDTSHAITLGLDGAADNRTFVYIDSGGDSWPVRFYYIVPAGLQRQSGVVKR